MEVGEFIKNAGILTTMGAALTSVVWFLWGRMEPWRRWSYLKALPSGVAGFGTAAYVVFLQPRIFGITPLASALLMTATLAAIAVTLTLGYKLQTFILWVQLRGPDGAKLADAILEGTKHRPSRDNDQ